MIVKACIICGKKNQLVKKINGKTATYCIVCAPLVGVLWKYDYTRRKFVNQKTGEETVSVDTKSPSRLKKLAERQSAIAQKEEGITNVITDPTTPCPIVFEYNDIIKDALWRVDRMDYLVAEFPNVRPDKMHIFHEVASTNPRSFKIVCRLFGIRPVIPPIDYDADDLRIWSRGDLADVLGITPTKLAEELESIRGAWSAVLKRMTTAKAVASVTNVPQVSNSSLSESQRKELLSRFRFSERMFKIENRDDSDSAAEREWFCQRIEDWKKLLEQPMAEMLTRQLLLKELDLERIRFRLCTLDPTAKEYERLQDILGSKEKEYQEMWDQLNHAFPIAALIAKRAEINGVLSDVIKGIQEYKADANNATLDGLFTFLEIQVLLRQSEQVPEPQYRFGYVTAVNEAMHFLWDTKWKSAIPHSIFKKLDAGFKEAAMRVASDADEQPPNIESNEGEYEPLLAVDKDLLKDDDSENQQAQPDNPEPANQPQQMQELESAEDKPDAGEDGEAEDA